MGKMSVTSAYIECATGKRYHSIELANSFLLKYRYWAFAKITASVYERSFECPASATLVCIMVISFHIVSQPSMNLVVLYMELKWLYRFKMTDNEHN